MTRDSLDITVGVDLIEVARIQQTMQRFGDRFLRKYFTPDETAYCLAKPRPSESLAARFAAKEAFAKAYPGEGPLRWRDVEIIMGKCEPTCCLRGAAAAFEAKLSLSHTHAYAMAVVLLRPREES